MAPKGPQDSFQKDQERPKSRQEISRRAPGEARKRPRCPKGRQDAHKGTLEAPKQEQTQLQARGAKLMSSLAGSGGAAPAGYRTDQLGV